MSTNTHVINLCKSQGANTQVISTEQALQVGRFLGIDFDHISLPEFRAGIEVEFEHENVISIVSQVRDLPSEVIAGMIALDHLRELPDYYSRLQRMENQAN